MKTVREIFLLLPTFTAVPLAQLLTVARPVVPDLRLEISADAQAKFNHSSVTDVHVSLDQAMQKALRSSITLWAKLSLYHTIKHLLRALSFRKKTLCLIARKIV